jgi:hypothetical protein
MLESGTLGKGALQALFVFGMRWAREVAHVVIVERCVDGVQ